MPDAPHALLVERHRLAADLKRLREEAGLTSYQLAEQLGFSQSKVSKIETGTVGAPVATVRRWAEVTGLTGERVAWLVERAERALSEMVSGREAEKAGLPGLQQEVAALERASGIVRMFHPVLVPGLLQTAAYRTLVVEGGAAEPRPDTPAAVAAMLERQTLLYDQRHRFEFIVAEAALRWPVGPPEVHLAQLDRILLAATLPNVEVAILSAGTPLPFWHSHGFTLFEDRRDGGDAIAHVEVLHGLVNVSKQDDLDDYREAFAALRERSVTGQAATDLVAGLLTELGRDSDS